MEALEQPIQRTAQSQREIGQFLQWWRRRHSIFTACGEIKKPRQVQTIPEGANFRSREEENLSIPSDRQPISTAGPEIPYWRAMAMRIASSGETR